MRQLRVQVQGPPEREPIIEDRHPPIHFVQESRTYAPLPSKSRSAHGLLSINHGVRGQALGALPLRAKEVPLRRSGRSAAGAAQVAAACRVFHYAERRRKPQQRTPGDEPIGEARAWPRAGDTRAAGNGNQVPAGRWRGRPRLTSGTSPQARGELPVKRRARSRAERARPSSRSTVCFRCPATSADRSRQPLRAPPGSCRASGADAEDLRRCRPEWCPG